MAVVWRDMRIPYTEEELDEFSKDFVSLSTFDPDNGDGGSVSSVQIPEIVKLMRTESTAEQIEVYTDYWNTHFEGRLPLNTVLKHMRKVHETESFFRSMAEHMDKDKDGFICEKEFDHILNILVTYDSSLKDHHITFEDFVKEADMTHDGRVNLDECAKWLKTKINP